MDEVRLTWWEQMHPGTVHYVPGAVVYRAANTGTGPLSFLGCQLSDAGQDNEAIRRTGFSARVREIEGRPALVGG